MGWGQASPLLPRKRAPFSAKTPLNRDSSANRSAAEKRGLWEGVVQEPLRRALFCVFLCSEVICKSHRNFSQKLPLQCRHFLENPLAKNPKTQLLKIRFALRIAVGLIEDQTHPNFAPSHHDNDQLCRNKRTQICSLSLGMTALLWTYSNRAVQIFLPARLQNLVDVSDIFYFFSSGEGKRESGAIGRGGGRFLLLKVPGGGGGGFFQEGGGSEGARSLSAGNLGRGLNILFRGRNARQEKFRGPTAIFFISRDTCSDSIAKLCRACF